MLSNSTRWARSLVGTAALGVCLLGAGAARAEGTQPKAPAKVPRQTGIDLMASLGGAVRIGDAPLFDVTQRGGKTFGLGAAYLFYPMSVGLTYERTGLGREDSGAGYFGAIRIERALDTVWASMRLRFSGFPSVVPLIGLGLGATWQSARVAGIYLPDGGLRGGQTFGCSATDSVNLALRAHAGAEVRMGSSVWFVAEGSFDGYRLSSDVFEGCAPGAGTTSVLTLRVGLLYRFDLTEGGKSGAHDPKR